MRLRHAHLYHPEQHILLEIGSTKVLRDWQWCRWKCLTDLTCWLSQQPVLRLSLLCSSCTCRTLTAYQRSRLATSQALISQASHQNMNSNRNKKPGGQPRRMEQQQSLFFCITNIIAVKLDCNSHTESVQSYRRAGKCSSNPPKKWPEWKTQRADGSAEFRRKRL